MGAFTCALVDGDKELTKKWKNTLYYKVFETLQNSNVISGPMRAMSLHYPRRLKITRAEYDSVLSKLTANDVLIPPKDVPGSFMEMISNDPVALAHYKKNRGAMSSMLNFLFEKDFK
jgi:hypothetical protein